MKHSAIIPIHKVGYLTLPENYSGLSQYRPLKNGLQSTSI